MMNNLNILIFIRMLIGGIYIFSGVEKLLSPVENFIFAIQSYDIVHHSTLIKMVATGFPWLELILGVFLCLGLWLRVTLVGIGTCSLIFIGVLGQAIIRRLAVTDCGCFGSLLSVPLPVTLILDIIILILASLLLIKIKKTAILGLDHYFSKN